MRKSIAKRSVALFALTLVWLILILAQLALPARAYSREIAGALEDGGDPDGLDGVVIVTDKLLGMVSAVEAETHDTSSLQGSDTSFDFPCRTETRVVRTRPEQRVTVLRLWFSFSSFVLRF